MQRAGVCPCAAPLARFSSTTFSTSKNYAAKTKKRVWRIFRSRFVKGPNPYELILPPARNRDKGTEPRSFFVPHVVIRARRIVAFLTCHILESEREYIILVSFSCPAVLSRTLISETVVFIACPAVPRIVRIDRIPVRPGQKRSPSLARQTWFLAGIGSKEDGSEDSGGIAPHARVTPRGGSRVPQNEGTVIEEKTAFSIRIPGKYRPIYFQAGISVAVTSARNSGQNGFVAGF